MTIDHKFTIPSQPNSHIVVYEYGMRVDRECQNNIWNQIKQARELYNNIINAIQNMFVEMDNFIMKRADDNMRALAAEIPPLIETFREYKAERNEEAMKETAQAIRVKRFELALGLKEVRAHHKTDLQELFFSRVGNKTSCETYQIRSKAVENGLGFATATDILNRALIAYKTRLKIGRPPMFSKGDEKLQDSITIQFTQAGGCPIETLLTGEHSGLSIRATNGYGPRRYGDFKFRLGAARNETFATGTILLHRPPPECAHVATAALVRKRIGKDYRYSLQLVLKLPPKEILGTLPNRFATVHFGWAGRNVMAIANQADPGAVQLITLPASIEDDLKIVEAKTSERDTLLNRAIEKLKEFEPNDINNEAVLEELASVKRLPENKISQNRLLRLCKTFNDNDIIKPRFLEIWRRTDRILLQGISHIANTARYRRRNFYRSIANNLASSYFAIVLETPNLKKANTKVDPKTGEMSELNRKSRYGQRLAGLSEAISLIRNAAGKTGCIILELAGEKTTKTCALCGKEGMVANSDENVQILSCPHCGAEINRKQNGAAIAWQLAKPLIDNLADEARMKMALEAEEREAATALKKEKMAAGRAAMREKREQAATGETGEVRMS